MTTETLLLRRLLGHARPEHYVEWAVDQLSDGGDGANLRILAGLDTRFDRDEVERYFRLTCTELELATIASGQPVFETVALLRQGYEVGELSALEVVEMMGELSQASQRSAHLLEPWLRMAEELEWESGYSYPRTAHESLDDAVRREWSLLDRALKLRPPDGWLRWVRCSDCGHVGDLVSKPRSVLTKVADFVFERPAKAPGCASCGSSRSSRLVHPDARAAYLADLEAK